MRIVSLLPGATEMVCALGLEENLVGVSHECILPNRMPDLPRVTTALIPDALSSGEVDRIVRDHARDLIPLYSLRSEELSSLRPELLVTQTLCRVCAVSDVEVHAVARSLEDPPHIIDLEPTNLTSLFQGIRMVADAAGVPEAGEELVRVLKGKVEAVVDRVRRDAERPRVVFLEWLDPLFSSGHWNPELVRLAGGIDPLGVEGEPARVVSWEEVRAAAPDLLFISCCGFSVERTLADLPLLTEQAEWEDLPAVRNGRVFIADGRRWFSAPGPGLVESLEILAHAIEPTLHPLPPGLPAAVRLADRTPGN